MSRRAFQTNPCAVEATSASSAPVAGYTFQTNPCAVEARTTSARSWGRMRVSDEPLCG